MSLARRFGLALLVSTLTAPVLAQDAGAVCGNGRIELTEQCDDGNLAGGDGCTADCQIEQQCYDPGPSFSFFVWSDSYAGAGESGVERIFADAVNRSRYPDRVIPRFWFAAGDIPFMVDGLGVLDGLNDTISNSTGAQNYPFSCSASNGKFPYFVAVGNHDVGGEGGLSPAQQYDYWSNYVGPRLPNTLVGISNFRWGPSGTQDARTTYSFDYKGGHFLVLNQYHGDPAYPTSDPVGCIRNDLLQWIDEDLTQTTRPMRFVFGHEPAWSYCSDVPGSGGDFCPVGSIDNLEPAYRPRPYSTTGDWLEPFGNHWGDSLEDKRCPSGSRQAFWSLLARHNVAAMFNGHTHTYSSRLVEGDGTRRNDVSPYDKGGDQFLGREGVWGIETGTAHNSAGAVYVLATVHETSVTFEAYDQRGMTEPFRLVESWTVASSQAPQVSIQSPVPGAIFASGTPVTIQATASDPDGVVTRVAFYAGSTLVGEAAASPYSVTWQNASPGQWALTAVATDDAGLSTTSAAVDITVNDPSTNEPPVLNPIPSQTGDEGQLFTFVASATDPEGNALTYSLVGAPAGASIDPSSGTFTWIPTEAQGPGQYSFTVRVTDNGSPAQAADQAATVTVREVNEAPVLASITDSTLNEGTALAVSVSATDPDVPANSLTYALAGGPPGMVVDGLSGGLSWTPTEAQGPGTYSVTVSVTDSGSPARSATTGFTVTVNEVNQAPVLAVISNKTVAEGTNLQFQASATDADIPTNTLTYSLVGAPAGATIDPLTGVFNWTPAPADVGTRTFAVNVTDSGAPPLSSQRSVTVTVTGRPDLTVSALSTKISVVALGSTLSASSSVTNSGASSAGASVTSFGLSPDPTYGGVGDVPFAAFRSIGSLAVGSTNTGSTTLTVPSTVPLGTYFLCASADGASAVAESNEANNGRCTVATIQVAAPDLRMTAVSPQSSAVSGGARLKVTTSVANDGLVAAPAFVVSFALSIDPSWSADDVPFATTRSLKSLGAGSTSSLTTNLTVPSSAPVGFYYVCALADSGASVYESDESNNASCSASRVEVR